MPPFKFDPFGAQRQVIAAEKRTQAIEIATRKIRSRPPRKRSQKAERALQTWLATQPWFTNAGPITTVKGTPRPIRMTQDHGASRYVRRFNPTLPACLDTVTPWESAIAQAQPKDTTL